MAKTEKNDRRAVADKLRAQQRRAERRRNGAIIGVCVVVAVLIVGAAAYPRVKDWWDQRQFADVDLASIGAPASVCQKVVEKDAQGVQDHVPVGTPMTYPDSPPAFGQHWEQWDPNMERRYYTADDRPELGQLVHNLEHGYTFLWYDQTVADDAAELAEVKAMARKFTGDTNFRMKFKAVPWTSKDGDPFPDGQHIAFTHWSKGGEQAQSTDSTKGVWQYCSEPSGAALRDFMLKYPYLDSPEPNGG